MDGGNIFQTAMKRARSAVSAALARTGLLRKRSEVRNRMVSKVKEGTKRLFYFRPESSDDYVSFGRWMVARRLAIFLMILVCFVSLCVIWVLKPSGAGGRIDAYRYNAIPLKYKKGRVIILGRSGYLAYDGEVENGAANGTGILYAPDGAVVYEGGFRDNMYSGEGKRYYPGNVLWYEGDFARNRFEGEGKLYRENGTLEYEGGFAENKKEGHGILYNGSGQRIYEGSFQKDRIVYEELLGRTATELAALYTGRKAVYLSEGGSCVLMSDIAALYRAGGGEGTLDGEWTAESIYVLEQSIYLNGELFSRIPQISAALGPAVYEGNTAVTMADAAAIRALDDRQGAKTGRVRMETKELFEDCFQVESYDRDYLVYLYRFDQAEYVYTFFCTEKNGPFLFYVLEENDM